MKKKDRCSEVDCKAYVELSACQVVGYGILHVIYIGNPVIGTHVGYIEQVEYIKSEPGFPDDTLKSCPGLTMYVGLYQCIAQSYVDAAV